MLILLSQRALWRCELSVHFSIESPWHKCVTLVAEAIREVNGLDVVANLRPLGPAL